MDYYDKITREEIMEDIESSRGEVDQATKDANALDAEYNELARLLKDHPLTCDSAIVLRMGAIKGSLARVSARKEHLEAVIAQARRALGQ